MFVTLIILTSTILWCSGLEMDEPSCDSPIYCQGQLLHTIQTSKIFNDSKTFVDMSLKKSTQETLKNFEKLMNENDQKPNQQQLRQFINEHFTEGNELDNWTPTDYVVEPAILQKIDNPVMRKFAQDLNERWLKLGKKVRKQVFAEPEKYSLIPVPNGFIAPGGRFTEFYYWDSYWIIKGLLVSNMTQTARGILENFLTIIDRYGFIPNGGRIYYLNRSQPPLLTMMIELYLEKTKNFKWLENNIKYLDQEMMYFLDKKLVNFTKNGQKYSLARYSVNSYSPRPESYNEDITTANYHSETAAQLQCYADLKAGAESGWDFSSRWFFDQQNGITANLSHIETSRIIPVDLNAILCKNFKILHQFYWELNNQTRSIFWFEKWLKWQNTIKQTMYDDLDGVWFDLDLKSDGKFRRNFYPSNLAPLWTECYSPTMKTIHGQRAVEYLLKESIPDHPGGIPTSLVYSGEQWDYPNAWAPLQAMIIFGLEYTRQMDAKRLAGELASKWLKANLIGFKQTNEMFEKYNAIEAGQYGAGGEYQVQSGFGWTNGVVLELIEYYYTNRCGRCV